MYFKRVYFCSSLFLFLGRVTVSAVCGGWYSKRKKDNREEENERGRDPHRDEPGSQSPNLNNRFPKSLGHLEWVFVLAPPLENISFVRDNMTLVSPSLSWR